MKELDKTKKYDLSKLTDEQLKEFIDISNKNVIPRYNLLLSYVNRYKDLYFLCFHTDRWFFDGSLIEEKETICATELFEYEKEYSVIESYSEDKCMTLRESINKAFEELNKLKEKINKPMTEEEKELWLFVYKESVKHHTFIPHKEKADQAVKDFREANKTDDYKYKIKCFIKDLDTALQYAGTKDNVLVAIYQQYIEHLKKI